MTDGNEMTSNALFRHLLIPLDGSAMSEAVMPTVVALADKTHTTITLLHLIEQHVKAQIHGNRHITTPEEAEQYLDQIAAAYFPNQNVNRHVHIEGTPNVARGVSAHAEEFCPDLIVMCAHKQMGWFRGCLGQQVVRDAEPPVLLMRYTDTISSGFPFRRVLIPLDGNAEHETGVLVGGELARLSGVPVELMQVVPTQATLGGTQGVARSYLPGTTKAYLELVETQAKAYLASQLARLDDRNIAGTATIVRGDPSREIIAYIEDQKPDLVVLGTHGKIGTKAFWAGSVAQRILESVNTTFLLAPANE